MIVAREHPARLVILGHPVSHSLSPVFQNAALEHAGLPVRSDRLDVAPEALHETLARLATERAGGNVTIPHKEAVAAASRCTSLAERVGAVNTFWHERGRLIGHNTDVAGATACIAALCPSGIVDRRCAVLGAGGSAAAVLVALGDLGCRDVVVATRSPERAARLVARLAAYAGVSARVAGSVEDAVAEAALVINATPLGMRDDAFPVSPAALSHDAAIFDLVYRVGETAWVRACRAAGHVVSDGLPMLIEQGAAAFECWFGMTAPREAMWRAIAVEPTGS